MARYVPSRSVIPGPLVGTRAAVTTYSGNAGEIPITATMVNIDGDGARTGLKFAGTGTAGQILIVNNTGEEDLRFDNTEGTALLRGVAEEFDLMETLGVYMFVSDGTYWNYIGGGSDAGGGLGDSS